MHNLFSLKTTKTIKTKKPILIQGLPGIGNVGKIAVEFLIENLDAKKVYDLTSSEFPNAVFINEHELVELPKISIYHKKIKTRELLLISGDVQPTNDAACYALSHTLLDLARKHHVQEIISLGGMGLETIPEAPRVYFAGTTPDILKKYKNGATRSVYGTVGPIVGMAGLLVGLAKEHHIPGLIMLAETLAHPNYLGVKGAREIISTLNTKLKLGINMSALDKEISAIEQNTKARTAKIEKLLRPAEERSDHASYIG